MRRVGFLFSSLSLVAFASALHNGPSFKPSQVNTPPALSDNAGVDFCRNPYQALCGSPADTARRQDLNEKALRLSQEVTSEAQGLTAQMLKARHANYDLVSCPLQSEAAPFPGHSPSEQNWEYKTYLQNIYSRLYGKVEEPHEMEAVRALAKKAIDREGPALGVNHADQEETKKKMKEKIDKITYVTTASALIKLAEYDPKRAQAGTWDKNLLLEFKARCGADGSQQNSYYNAITNSVILCPGIIARAMQDSDFFEDGDPNQTSHSFLTEVLAHETGHALNESDFPLKYEAWKRCQDPRLVNAYAPVVKNAFNVDHYHAEMLADSWASQMLAEQTKMAHSPAQVEKFLKGASELYCDLGFSQNERLSQGEGGHLSGADRILWGVGDNEDIRREMQCAPPRPQHPLCSFSGKLVRPSVPPTS